MAGRPRGAWTPDKVRSRIRTGVLLTRLKKHALGQLAMTATQLKAAEILLRKVLPDLKALEVSGEIAHRHTSEMSEAELERIAAGGSAGVAEATQGAQNTPGVH